jgi:hypothetical protein
VKVERLRTEPTGSDPLPAGERHGHGGAGERERARAGRRERVGECDEPTSETRTA